MNTMERLKLKHMFKGIPYQIKLTTTSDESRKQLPDYFVESIKASKDGETMLCFYVNGKIWELDTVI